MTTDTPDTDPIDAPVSTAPLPEPPQPGPGAMIREARERLHLSLEDLAAHTKLSRQTLDALERDDYHALLEPVYVRGYYRKCAKVLEMDDVRLIAAYERRVSPRIPEAPSKLRLASGTELGSSSKLPMAMAVIFAVAAVVVPALLWLTRDRQEAYPPTPVVAPVELAPLASPDPEPAGAAVPVPLNESAPEAAPPLAEEAVATDTESADPAAVQAGTLHMRFAESSWVRIDDAGGKVLLNQTQPAGSERTVQGAAPLSVFLGNAPGVALDYEGRRIDVSKYVRENKTARFSLPLP